MDWLGHQWRLLDPRLFWRKTTLLVVFFGLFIPIFQYRGTLATWYAVFLLALHVYILFVFLYRVRWRVFAQNRRPFIVRLVAIATFVALLMLIRVGTTLAELVLFVALSGLVHLALLLSLTVDVRPLATGAASEFARNRPTEP